MSRIEQPTMSLRALRNTLTTEDEIVIFRATIMSCRQIASAYHAIATKEGQTDTRETLAGILSQFDGMLVITR